MFPRMGRTRISPAAGFACARTSICPTQDRHARTATESAASVRVGLIDQHLLREQ